MYNEIKSIKEPTEEDCYLGIIRAYQREVDCLQKENKQLKEGLYKILDLNKRAINCDSQKITIKYLLKQYDLIYETLGELQPGLMKGDKENE